MGETVDVLVVGEFNLVSFITLSFPPTHLLPLTPLLGGKYGSGRRAGGVSSILCGVLDDRYKEGEPK